MTDSPELKRRRKKAKAAAHRARKYANREKRELAATMADYEKNRAALGDEAAMNAALAAMAVRASKRAYGAEHVEKKIAATPGLHGLLDGERKTLTP